MKERYNINITTGEETVLKSVARDAATFALFFALIGAGVVLDSTAMQWAGFVIAWLTVLAMAARATKFNLTIEQAQDFLRDLEGKQ